MSKAHLSRESLAPGVALLTLSRPERLNALTWELIDDLHAALVDIGRDESVRVVVLTGEGRGFCAGLDIVNDDPFGRKKPPQVVFDRQERVAGLALALRNLPQPVIAAVNGPASGGGLALALASDIRLAAPSAIFNVAFVRIGLSGCDVGVSHLLPRIVGLGMASELMLTGRRVDAEEALRIGLVNRVVPEESLLEEAVGLAAEITRNSPFGVRMTKQVLGRNVDAPSLEAAIDLENRTQVVATRTGDAKEALEAFLARRTPTFDNR
jgi:enoyl-CoA hydratase